MTVAWCVKCRQKREMKNESKSKTSKGVLMTKGECTTCGTRMCKIGG